MYSPQCTLSSCFAHLDCDPGIREDKAPLSLYQGTRENRGNRLKAREIGGQALKAGFGLMAFIAQMGSVKSVLCSVHC